MKLLLAEDERELSHATKTMLEIKGFEVDTAYDGEQALKLSEENVYDGYILDIMMPKTDGLTVLKTLRSHGEAAPIIMLTAKAEIDDKVTGLEYGANDYMTKPFAIKELLARLNAMLRTNEQLMPPIISAENFHIDREKQYLESDVSSVSLSFHEFRLMEIFMRHINHGFTCEKLLEKVWNNEKDVSVVPVYVAYINNKLMSVCGKASIKKIGNEYIMTAK